MVPDNPAVIDPVLGNLKKAFRSGKTRSLKFRKTQLQNLLKGLKEMEEQILVSIQKDIGYGNKKTANLFGLIPVIGEIHYTINNFEDWAKSREVSTSLLVGPGKTSLLPEPFGVTLVMGAWNYPFATTIGPAATAIAAGNCVALKPSEMSPNTSNIMKELFEKYLDKECYAVIEGQIEVAKVICTKPWDHIIFTGSPMKGKLVAKAAAENLIPVTLELGGKSPTIIDQTADLDNAVLRVCSGKIQNAGQTCIAPDFALVHESVKEQFLEKFKSTILQFTENKPETSGDFPRMINEFHTKRMQSMINNHGGSIYYGGEVNVAQKYVQPTIIVNPKIDSECMVDEIFGPLFPVLTYKNFDEVINFINDRPKPLALYYFGTDKSQSNRLIKETSSGSLSINECVVHYINQSMPFGGVGNSGQGAIHGKFGFENCSHLKPILDKSGKLETANSYPLSCRFPPYTDSKMKTLSFMLDKLDIYPSEMMKSKTFLSVAVIIPTVLAYWFNPWN